MPDARLARVRASLPEGYVYEPKEKRPGHWCSWRYEIARDGLVCHCGRFIPSYEAMISGPR